MSYETIIFEKQNNIGIVKFNRPKALNAINSQVMIDLGSIIDEVEKDASIKVLVMTGEGEKSFIAGADISQMVNFSAIEAKQFSREGQDLLFRLETLPIPVIACVNGFALGGGTEFAMSADFIYASEKAKFGQPEINLGVIPGFGGTQRLSRRVGVTMAKELCMTGVIIGAKEAKEIGLVNRVFAPEELWEQTMKTAELIASKGKPSMQITKETIQRGYDLDLRNACYMESEAFGVTLSHPDGKEGFSAFLEKRAPKFEE